MIASRDAVPARSAASKRDSASRATTSLAFLVVALSILAFAVVPALAGTPGTGAPATASPGVPASNPAPVWAAAASVAPAAGDPPAIGQVTISSGGVSSNPAAVGVSGTTATVLESFNGNLTDFFAGSFLNGAGYTVNASSYLADANAVGLAASGITVENLHVVSRGTTSGIVSGTGVSSETISAGVTVTLLSGSTTANGIELGNVFPATATEPTGTFTVGSDVVVTGPGTGGAAGEVGVLVYGASVDVGGVTVTGFPLESTSTNGSTTYSSWFEDYQSVGIFVGCANTASTCRVEANTVSDSSIGIAYALVTSGFGSIPTVAPYLESNTVTDSIAYGLLAEPTGAAGTVYVEDNTFNNSLSGAPGVYLIGANFDVVGNVFVGTNTSGSNGAFQGQDSCDAHYNIATASVEASDACNPTTTVTLTDNLFVDTVTYWSTSYHHGNPGSALSGGELVTYRETGLPLGTNWNVRLGVGPVVSLPAPTAFVWQSQNGTNSYSVGPVAGWFQGTVPASGSLTVSGAPVDITLAFFPLATGEIVITPSGTSTDPGVVSVTGTTATLETDYAGNITDEWADSTLDGANHSVNATGFPSDSAAISLEASGIVVEYVGTFSSGATTGILVDLNVTEATIDHSTIDLTAAAGAPGVGLWAGNFDSADPNGGSTVGDLTIVDNTVIGPGGGPGNSPVAGSIGILAAGEQLTITNNTVSGFSGASGVAATGYNWYQGTQSVAIMGACTAVAAGCSISGNAIGDSVIGIVNLLFGSNGLVYQTGGMTIANNTITASLGYGIFQEWTNDGLSSGPVRIEGNLVDNTATGAPGMVLGGGTIAVAHNVLVGASDTGTQGASETNWVGGPLPTASIAVVTGDESTTHVTLNANLYLDTNLTTAYLAGAGSTFSGGELVTFTETGLPAGTPWTVTLNGTPGAVAAPGPIVGQLQNGTGVFRVGAIAGYNVSVPLHEAGTFSVSGTPQTIAVSFSVAKFGITFVESGILAKPLAKHGWTVVLNGTVEHSTTDSISFAVPAGTYPVLIVGPHHFAAPGSGAIAVSATDTIPVAFAKGRTVGLTFHEKGLPRGQSWCVEVNGYEQCAVLPHLTYRNLSLGSYAYSVVSPLGGQNITAKVGKLAIPTTGSLAITKGTRVQLAFVYPYAVTFTETGLATGTWSITVHRVTEAAPAGSPIVFELGNHTYL